MLTTKNPIGGMVSKEPKILKPSAVLADVGRMRSAAYFTNFECIKSGGSSPVIPCDHIPEADQENFKFSFETVRE